MAQAEDRRRLSARLRTFEIAVAVAFTALALSFWYLQVVRYTKYRELAENNYQRTLALRAPRGILFDRDNTVLVENRESYNISILRENLRDQNKTVETLARVTGRSKGEIQAALHAGRNLPSYRAVPVIEDATLDQVAAVVARRLESELPDVIVERMPTRAYPPQALAAHVFGYVGEATDSQVGDGLKPGDIVGQSGLERSYNSNLMGTDGARRVIVNSVGREIRALEEVPALGGRRVRLTLDYDMQKATEEAFRLTGYVGAAVALDPRTGEVLTFVSLPAYDPNDFATGVSPTVWAALNTDRLRPLQNRAIQGLYSPGSTFKIVVATAALEEGIVTPDFKVFCGGSAVFYGRPFQCHLKGGHGWVDMRHAIEKSCNVYFYTLGNMLGVDRIEKWAKLLGLGVRSGINLPNEVSGLVPSTAWKLAVRKEKWYAGETISVAIGQGQVTVTPLSLGLMMMTVANGGTRHTPRLVREVDDGSGWKPVQVQGPQSVVRLKPETVSALHDGLWMVVNGQGTGGRARLEGRDVAGKTGTAQVISIEGAKKAAGPHADGPARPRLVPLLCAAGRPGDCGGHLRGTLGARISGGADSPAPHGHLLREEGRQAGRRVAGVHAARAGDPGRGTGDSKGFASASTCSKGVSTSTSTG